MHSFKVVKNLSKYITVFIFLGLGSLLIPRISYACAKKTVQHNQASCSKDHAKNEEQKDCCNTESGKTDGHEQGCKDNCNHSSCRCSITSTSLGLDTSNEYFTSTHFTETKRQKFCFKETYYPSGYRSIWLPPKIS